jgi:hypothetical protein
VFISSRPDVRGHRRAWPATLLAVLAAAVVAAAPAAAYSYLSKPEAKTQAAGFARRLCNQLDDCIGVRAGLSYECSRAGALVVDCPVTLEYATDVECDITVRVTEHASYYNRRLIYSPDCH